jgi:polar amino acid transport system permease protein
MESLSYIWLKMPLLLKGSLITIELTFLAIVFGTIIGLLIALCKVSGHVLLSSFGKLYTWVFRGIPLLVQLIFIYYALPDVGLKFEPIEAAVIGLSMCGGAYIAEIIRAAILSIDKGQMEAALSLGMTYRHAMARVIIPQTYRRLIPPLGNEFITLMKDTSLVSAVSMTELLRQGQLISSVDWRSLEIYAAVAVIYLIMTTFFTVTFSRVEAKLALME